METLEEKLFSRLGKKMAQFSAKPAKATAIKINIDLQDKDATAAKGYEHLFSKFSK
jgi:hypothetical protein